MSKKDNNKIRPDKNCLLMGIDLGTSTIKVGIFDLEGRELTYQAMEYNLIYPGKELVENDVEKYWEALTLLIKKALDHIGSLKLKIIALSLSSQGETIVPIDSNIRPLRNAIVWLDGRSGKQAKEIASHFPEEEMYKITGQPISDPTWPASRIKWLKDNEPDIFEKTYKFLLIEDFIIYKLTGKLYSETTAYNSSYYFDINTRDFYKPMLDYLGLGRDKFPEIKSTGTVIGNICKEASEETGLDRNIKFVLGAMDQLAGAIGAGNIKEGIVTETTGSVFCMTTTTDELIFDYDHKVPCYLHGIKDKYCLLPYSMTGGMVLKWFKENFYKNEEDQVGEEIFNLMAGEAEMVNAGSDGLIMIPHISGAFIPENNPDARGVFYGIGINHTRAHFVRAIMESIGFMMRNDIGLLNNLDIEVKKIISMGGGAKSRLWNQIKADITGIEINVPENTETAVLGAAMIAGVGIGSYSSFDEAVKRTVRIKDKYTPDKDIRDIYDENFLKYNDLYKKLEDTFKK